jgi:hypothetical protein
MFAHATGFSWDEALMMFAPIAAICGLWVVAQRRVARKDADPTEAEGER